MTAYPLDRHFTQASSATYFELQPSALVSVNESFASDTGQFTRFTENTPATFTISGTATLANPNASDRNDIIVEGADVGMPQVCVMIDVVSHSNNGGTPNTYDNIGVGIAKDANNFVFASYDRINANIRVQTKVAGVTNFDANVGSTNLVAPYKLALSIVANSAVVWVDTTNTGASWAKLTSFSLTTRIDLKSVSLTGWKGAFTAATHNNSTWVFDNFKIGRFGAVGLRDMTFVTSDDGTPFVSARSVSFTGSGVDPTGTGYMGVFTLNLDTYAIAQTAVVMTSRSSKIQNDLSGHIVIQANGNRRLMTSSWGNGFSSTLSVLTASTATNILSGANVVAVTALSLPAHSGSPGGEYDPFLVLIGSTYYLAYTVTTDTAFTGNPFFTALATSADLTTWGAVGADSGNTGFEGTKIFRSVEGYFITSGGHTTARVYSLAMAFLGLLDLTTVGGTDTFPHAMAMVDGSLVKILTFDNTKYSGGAFTWGKTQIYTATDLNSALLMAAAD